MEPRNCSATTAKGSPCRRTALPDTEPPLCVSHVGVNGRKSKLSDELTSELVLMLRAGNYVVTACAAVGISRRTFEMWCGRGEPEYQTFRKRVEKARAEGEARNVAAIARAATKDWHAAAWLLERQHPERWARPTQRGLTDVPDVPEHDIDPLDAIDAPVVSLEGRRTRS
jgi:hypothetical protein